MDVDGPKDDLEGQGQRSRSPGQKCYFTSDLTILQVIFEVKGHMCQGHCQRSQVTLVKVKFEVG